ncbi:MAG TPA: peptidase S10 [Terriglobales bacterium]
MRLCAFGILLGILCSPVLLTAQASQKTKSNPEPAAARKAEEPAATVAPAPAKTAEPEKPGDDKAEHYDMTEVPPVVTHHQTTVEGKLLKYTATAGRLPIKRDDGKILAEMFFVAYTLDGQDAATRPLTFAFNGGPGSATVWLHMGALGPERVVMQPNGFMPEPPYRSADNPYTALTATDLVMVDAIGTGFSRAASAEEEKKFLSVTGDVQAFGEFIRAYITRYERWISPLLLVGESYGTTRAAGIAGYLADNGIAFNGITLLSSALAFQTLEFTKANDLPYVLIVPSYFMIAAYHKKLGADLLQDLDKTRHDVEHWAMGDYAQALAKGDALTAQERQTIIEQVSRYTGLSKEIIDQANLRIDVAQFTHNLLLDQKVRVGRLDGRFSGPDPKGLLDTPFYDPSMSETLPPYTAVFNQYVRNELGYKSDMPYRVFAFGSEEFKWEWGSAEKGFPDTATELREAMAKNPYLKVLVMEGYYDLATPYFAANYTMDHLNLPDNLRQNISYATYNSGHMVYLNTQSLAKFRQDLGNFIAKSLPGGK